MWNKRVMSSEKLTNKSDIDTSYSERSALSSPTEAILQNPGIEAIFGFLSEAEVRCCDSLQYIVVVLGGTEDARRGVWNIPDI
jgi:hypothetical protein